MKRNNKIFLTKLYNIKVNNNNNGFVGKKSVANMIQKESDVDLSDTELRETINELVNKGLVEKSSNGIRISGQGVKSLGGVKRAKKIAKKSSKKKSKKPRIVAIVILGIIILAYALNYFGYITI